MRESTQAVLDALEGNSAFAVEETEGPNVSASVETTPFEATVSATPAGEGTVAFTVTVAVPTLRAAVTEAVGTSLLDGWLDAFERRVADAPKATRASVDLDEFEVDSDDERVVVTYAYTFGDAEGGVSVAKTFVEYVEGTYVQGIVPGFSYESPVDDLLGKADQSSGGPGGTPL